MFIILMHFVTFQRNVSIHEVRGWLWRYRSNMSFVDLAHKHISYNIS